ncbi:MAG: hypothetical protein AAFV98_10510 [Chloroflexota bacterium]
MTILDVIAHTAGLFGYVAIGILLVIIAQLSQRLGRVTRAKPYFVGNYLAALLIWGGASARFYFITRGQANLDASESKVVYILLCDGLPALGMLIGLLVTWYYWSWLLAERD